jgi:hypothetical protein
VARPARENERGRTVYHVAEKRLVRAKLLIAPDQSGRIDGLGEDCAE